jgi:WD40 repeat protein
VQVWETATGRLVWAGEEHRGPVRAIAWSADGQWIASAGDDATVQLWNAADGQLLRTLAHEAAVTDVAFSPAGDLLLTASTHVQLWEPETGQLVETFRLKQPAPRAAFSPDGRLFAAGRCAEPAEDSPFACAEEGEILLWETAGRTFLGTLRGHGGLNVLVAFSPDGSRLLSVSDDATLRMWAVSP